MNKKNADIGLKCDAEPAKSNEHDSALASDLMTSQDAAEICKLPGIKTEQEIRSQIETQLKKAFKNQSPIAEVALANKFSIPPANSAASSCVSDSGIPKNSPRTFSITLYEEDEDDRSGKLIRKVVNGGAPEIITVNSPQELKERLQLYKLCGQYPQVKDITPVSDMRNSVPTMSTSGNSNDDKVAAQPVQALSLPSAHNSAPKYYKIGNIDIKNENGKLYQKQWVRISSDEEQNIRVVNDKTNGLVNLTGKHIEMMKWVLVETEQ